MRDERLSGPLLALFSGLVSLLEPLVYFHYFVAYDKRLIGESPTKDERGLLQEYKVLDDSVRQRENSLLVSGSIFITASTVLLGQSALASNGAAKIELIFGSWLLYSLWLFLYQLTNGKLSNRTYERLGWIEENKLKFQAHSYLRNYRGRFRRWTWLALLVALLLIGNALMGLIIVVVLLLVEQLLLVYRIRRNQTSTLGVPP